jgi:hypothetical protein
MILKKSCTFSEILYQIRRPTNQGDSLYYDRNKEFASATRNVKITILNRGIVKGHYTEIYKQRFHVCYERAVVLLILSKMTRFYIHGKDWWLQEKRTTSHYNVFVFFKTDMSGKCDSIHSSAKDALTKLIGNQFCGMVKTKLQVTSCI